VNESPKSAQVAALARIAALAAAVFAVYSNSFAGAFVFDDNALIVDNPAIRRFEPLAILRTSGSRPLLNLSLAANYAWGGLEPFGYHVFNLSVHLAAVWLLYAVVRATLRSPRRTLDCPQERHSGRPVAASAASRARQRKATTRPRDALTG
jgi:hypothetical protein